jgi:hypothetical protein
MVRAYRDSIPFVVVCRFRAPLHSEFFDMLSTDARDAAFIDFFTGDEHRFKVLVKTLMMMLLFGKGISYRTYTVSLISK